MPKQKDSLFLSDIWPMERDYIVKPERAKYLRRSIVPDTCVFCDIAAKTPCLKNLCIYKDDKAMVVLNKYPYNTGHVLVLPLKHTGSIQDLSSEAFAYIMDLLKFAVEKIQKEYKPQALNIGCNLGAAAGAGIPGHLHWHIVPRWFGDTNFFPLLSETKVLSESLEDTYKRLAPYFKKFKGLSVR